MLRYFRTLLNGLNPGEWREKRVMEMEKMADHHDRKAVEMATTSHWAQLKSEHHRQMAAMYKERSKCLTRID